MRRLLILVVLMSMCGTTSAEPLTKAEVDRFVQPLVDGEWCQSVVVGLVDREGKSVVYSYGRTSPAAGGSVPNGKTVYEIGSATKAFTGVLLADMVQRGEASLDDPVQKLLPAEVKLPQKGDRSITLLDLVTHRSGLPRLPDNMSPKDPANPYADYTKEQLYAFLQKWEPAREPGEAYEYSNLGVGLLGHLLARKAGKSYEALLTERVLKPAGMSDSSITLSADQKKRLAPPFDADGSPVKNWDLSVLAGAGGLRSTGDDMVKFVHAAMATGAPSSKTFAFSYESRARAVGDNDIGLAWHISTGSKSVWHNGQTAGYHSYVGFVPAKAGVVVLTNTATGLIDEVGAKLLARLEGKPAEPKQLKTAVKLKATALAPLVGKYPLAPQFVLNITREDDRLYLQATGQPRFRLFASSPLEFYLRAVDARVTFDQPVGGKSPKLVLHQNGQDMPGVRQK